jgi:hypothetical protein
MQFREWNCDFIKSTIDGSMFCLVYLNICKFKINEVEISEFFSSEINQISINIML